MNEQASFTPLALRMKDVIMKECKIKVIQKVLHIIIQ